MFTGIVEFLGEVASIDSREGGMRVGVSAPDLGLEVGDSIAVNGVCLTAVDCDDRGFAADVVLETIAKSNLANLTLGNRVNLERPMAADGRFDGHIMQGHVDGVGIVASVEPEGDGRRMVVQVSDDLIRYVVGKGSISLDGVSLTVAEVRQAGTFEVALIPHTLEVTTLGIREAGDELNVEVDVIAKYVERLMGERA